MKLSRRSDDFDFAVGDGGEEFLTIALIYYSAVEDGDDAGVGFCPNQSSEALLEFENSRRQLVVVKRIAALLLYQLKAACNQRLVRDGKREAHDNDVAKRFAGDVDTLPETIGAEKDCAIFGLEEF